VCGVCGVRALVKSQSHHPTAATAQNWRQVNATSLQKQPPRGLKRYNRDSRGCVHRNNTNPCTWRGAAQKPEQMSGASGHTAGAKHNVCPVPCEQASAHPSPCADSTHPVPAAAATGHVCLIQPAASLRPSRTPVSHHRRRRADRCCHCLRNPPQQPLAHCCCRCCLTTCHITTTFA
jgi:hypothetical protein